MQAEAKVCFYLGANSPTGFYSLYDQLLEPEQAETIYILKGGPGCGKSSLMRLLRRPGLPRRGGVPRPEHRHCGRHRSSWLSNRRIL